METKKCTKCGKEKSVSEFYKCSAMKDGHQSWCKKCQKEYSKKYHSEHKIQCKKAMKRWRERNREYLKKYKEKWREENPEYYREYYKKNREHILECLKEYRANPRNKLNKNTRTAISRSLSGNKNGRHWEELVGYTLKELKQRLEFQFTKKMSWENYGFYWEIDHKKPISWFDYEKPEDQAFKDCWALVNLQPLEVSKNRSKNNRCIG